MSRIAPPPLRTTVLDQLGNLSTKWLSWLRTLRIAAESALDVAVLEQFAEINDAPPEDRAALESFGPPEMPADLDLAIAMGKALDTDTFWPEFHAGIETLQALAPADRNWSELRAEQDTFANRGLYPAAAMPEGSLFRATDKLVVWQKRIVAGTPAWVYVAGIWHDTLANLPTANLGSHDAGLLYEVTDYGHVLIWQGAAWAWAPGEIGSGYLQDFPIGPNGGAWQLCDGTATTYLQSDGTTLSYTTPNLTGHFRKSVTSGSDVTAAAVAPGFTGTPGTTGNDGDAGSHAAAGAGGDPLVALNPHTHAFTPAGTVDATGQPAAYKVLTYFRR